MNATRVHVNELWSFTAAKGKNIARRRSMAPATRGLERRAKPIPKVLISHFVGGRNGECAMRSKEARDRERKAATRMHEREERLLRVLISRRKKQYSMEPRVECGRGAFLSLVEYGLMREVQGCLIGEWTEAGLKALRGEPLDKLTHRARTIAIAVFVIQSRIHELLAEFGRRFSFSLFNSKAGLASAPVTARLGDMET